MLAQSPKTTENATWDIKTQQYHGGQEWLALDNFVEDFSVTTNGLGTPVEALRAAKKAVSRTCCFIQKINVCHHYPPANQEPAKAELARFLAGSQSFQSIHSRLLLGNGASELIDLTTRMAPEGPWKPGPSSIQYKEYERSARSLGRIILSHSDPEPASLMCIVNPNNPTGDYMPLEELKQCIESTAAVGSTVMVDESMQESAVTFHKKINERRDLLLQEKTRLIGNGQKTAVMD
jgi:histidinol-phosphate/aromatic aminotransferase/cobyric acid decarboxylase-like protein